MNTWKSTLAYTEDHLHLMVCKSMVWMTESWLFSNFPYRIFKVHMQLLLSKCLYFWNFIIYLFVHLLMCACQHAHARAHMWMCVCRYAHATDPMWTSEDNSGELVLSCHVVGSGNWTQVFRSVCKHLCPLNHPTPGFTERDLCLCLMMASARQPCYVYSKTLSARSTQGVSQLRALYKEFPHHEEGIFPQLGNRVSLSPLTPIRKETIPQGGAPWRSLQHNSI